MTSEGAIGIVAGSGLALESLLDTIDDVRAFEAIDGLPAPGVTGHGGRFVSGRVGDRAVVIQCGRLHFYEGHDFAAVTRPVEVLARMGVGAIVFTNAAGGLVPGLEPGTLFVPTNVLVWPCRRWPGAPECVAPTMELPRADASGVYCWVHGPTYETRAEIRALQQLGADAVGMSIAPELARAHQLGLATAVLTCITNACGRTRPLTHREVVATAAGASHRLVGVLREAMDAPTAA